MHSASGLLVSCDSKLLCNCSRTQQAPIARVQAPRAATAHRIQSLASPTSATPRIGGQQLLFPVQQQHQQQQLHAFVQTSSSCRQQPISAYCRHRTSCLAAAAQEQPVTGIAAAEEEAASVSSNAEHNQPTNSSSSNGTEAHQQQQEAPSSSSSKVCSGDQTASPGISINVLEPGQLNAVARLRAEAYYEVRCSCAIPVL